MNLHTSHTPSYSAGSSPELLHSTGRRYWEGMGEGRVGGGGKQEGRVLEVEKVNVGEHGWHGVGLWDERERR